MQGTITTPRVHRGIVERHADEAAFLWSRRDRAVRSPVFDAASIAEIDARLAANLEGLVLAGEHGLEAAQKALARMERRTSDVDGEVFTVAHVAAEIGDVMALAKVLRGAEGRARGARPIVSALAWLSQTTASRVLGEMSIEDGPPWLLRLALGARAARREDPGDALRRALDSGDPALRDRGFRAAVELGRRDVVAIVESESRAGDQASFSSLWSAAMLGVGDPVERLWSIAEAGGPSAETASATAARASTADACAARLRALARKPEGVRAALAGAAARGDSAAIPWVLEILGADAEAAHRAAWVYATITGAALDPPLAVRKPTTDMALRDMANRRADEHRDLPSPEPAAIEAHWSEVRASFPAGPRFLGGKKIEPVWLTECLRTGPQPWRHAASVELFLRGARPTLFPVRAPMNVQLAALRAPKSEEKR